MDPKIIKIITAVIGVVVTVGKAVIVLCFALKNI